MPFPCLQKTEGMDEEEIITRQDVCIRSRGHKTFRRWRDFQLAGYQSQYHTNGKSEQYLFYLAHPKHLERNSQTEDNNKSLR